VNIQIFGKSKCFDTKKAERWFKERRVKFQSIDIVRFGISRGEFSSVKSSVGLAAMIDEDARNIESLRYLAYDADKEQKLLEEPQLIKTPIVRNGRAATVGYRPDIWAAWE
jgi:arsenate reductase-like glutaredoxin family protein